jgi:hypothetical protein
MFTLADAAEGKTKAENALLIKKQLEALKESIPVIRKMEVFINSEEAPGGNHDIVLDSEFDTMDDLKAYIVHPEHVKVAEFVGKVRTGRAAIDYEF